jgi:hypothetical protein
VVGRPLLLISTDSQAQDPLMNRRVNVAAKSRPEPTPSVAGRPALEPLLLMVWPHVVYVSQTFL